MLKHTIAHMRALTSDFCCSMPCTSTGVPSLRDLMFDDLRWSWCNNNRSKMHNTCNALESSWGHPSSVPVPGQSVSVFHKTGPWCHKGYGPPQEGNTDVHPRKPIRWQVLSTAPWKLPEPLRFGFWSRCCPSPHRRDPGHTTSLPELASTLSEWRRCKHLAGVLQGCQDPKLHTA